MIVHRVTGRLLAIVMLTLGIVGGVGLARAQDGPRRAVEAFLDTWNAQDYAAMYTMIYIHTVDGQPEYPEQAFINRYLAAEQTLNLTGLRYQINDVQVMGDSAAVTYDVVLQSGTFGDIPDSDRTMRLLRQGGRWLIAWTPMDIISGLTRDGQIRVQAQSGTRAPILDRNGLPIAQDGGTTVALYSARGRMSDEEACLDLLARISFTPIIDLRQRFTQFVAETVFFLAEVPADVYQRNLTGLRDLCGVTDTSIFTSLPHRTYYGGAAMVHITGYVGQVTEAQEAEFGSGQIIGQAGVESAYNDALAGRLARVVRVVDPAGIVLRELASASGTDPASVQLTIDRELQLIVAEAMNDAFNYGATNWAARGISPGGAAVVLDVNTGEILALTSYPLFNPSLFNPSTLTPDRGVALQSLLSDTRSPLSNRATAEQFSPGSVFKIITMAAVLNEGIIGLDDNYFCDLYWEGQPFGDTLPERQDWRVVDDMEAAGNVSPAEALMASCNPWFWEHGARLYQESGADTLAQYARRMGLAQTYGFRGALREVEGVVPVPASADIAISEAVGQGDVALPPLQMAVTTAAIANGGTVYRPYLVQQVGGMDGTPLRESYAPEVLNMLDFEPGVLEAVQEGMCGVTTVDGLGTAYGRFVSSSSEYSYVDLTAPYTVCGKTGTAQTARYPNAWFVAYAPRENPEIAVVVMVEQSLEGSQVAAPIARRILDDYFNAPRESFPRWWNTDTYQPLEIPEGGGAG